MVFYPSRFWHTRDWESSTTRPRDGYVVDDVLYAGDFDEVSIHLFPRVRTVRVRSVDAGSARLEALGLQCSPGSSAHIFVNKTYRTVVESFRPTLFTFDSSGFTHARRGEYVSRKPQRAMTVETLSMAEAMVRWNIEACYVDDLDPVIERLRGAGIYFDEQT